MVLYWMLHVSVLFSSLSYGVIVQNMSQPKSAPDWLLLVLPDALPCFGRLKGSPAVNYRDQAPRTLTTGVTNTVPGGAALMTVEKCTTACKGRNLQYAGLEYAQECCMYGP